MMVRFARQIVVALLATAALTGTAQAETYRWVQYVADGAEVRAITTKAQCPVVEIDGVAAPMSVRVPADKEDGAFPVLVCIAKLPLTAKTVAVDHAPLKAPPHEINRIVVIGDTGCRMKGETMQACNDPVEWPFRMVADEAAYKKPDLVIHVGDYNYRETRCPDGNAGCAGSPIGDTYAVWQADFFSPAETLLAQAPWILVRGNHEDCARAGKGWMRLLDPYPAVAGEPCADIRPPYLAKFAGQTMAVLDVASASEPKVSDSQKDIYKAQFATLSSTLSGPSWLLLHRPIWGVALIDKGIVLGSNLTLAAASGGTLPQALELMIAGHIHTFQVANYAGSIPPQIISGHSGDNLDRGVPDDLSGLTVNNMTISKGLNMPAAFGFMMLERQGKGWLATDYDVHGNAVKQCLVEDRAINCR
jgi:hypothetical protein